jgi:hypothetical protein
VLVRVKARARKTRIVGVSGGMLEVALAAPPVDGAANEELMSALAEHFGLRQRDVTIVAGQTSRQKRVRLAGMSARAVVAKLGL